MERIALIIVCVDNHTPKIEYQCFQDVIYYDPEKGQTWHQVQKRLNQLSVKWVLLLYSNENLIAKDYWFEDLSIYQKAYQRLYQTETFLTFSSLLDAVSFGKASPPSLLEIKRKEIEWEKEGWRKNRTIYLLEKGDWAEAETIVKNGIAENPVADMCYLLAHLYDQTHRYHEAAVAVEKGIEIHDDQAEISKANLFLLQGKIAEKTGDYKKAVTAYQCSFHESEQAEGLVCWAELMEREGHKEEDILRQLDDFFEEGEYSKEHLIEVMVQIGTFSAAMKMIQETGLTTRKYECLIMTGQIPQAIDWLQDKWELQPNLLLDLILCYLSEKLPVPYQQLKKIEMQEEGPLFIQLLTASSSISPQSVSKRDRELLSLLLNRALELRLVHVAEMLHQPFEDELFLGKKLYQKGYVMRSASCFIEALEKQKLDHEGYRYLGEILYHQGKYEEAASFFDYVLSQFPSDASLRTALILSNLQQSYQLLNESLTMFPSSTFLREEKEKVRMNIERLEHTHALTQWSGMERKNYYV
ncbi:tetratricopeptide repeat protein [Microaerobacter geothermalis]|uniref:tetratricopeptide repeat protein n=1 Tax=Microaerobacter geothermalis TaxID=674972 RepID=UPI001F287281|nr:tetratricopeptide repeat protein [Microaerobacter geothermalis]MCF6093306.1 tetratricopeptide repeat protein [Microaerobacter geothermalis]